VQVAGGVVLESLPGAGFALLLGHQVGQPRHALALEQPPDGGAGGPGVDVGAGDRHQVVQRQQHGAPQFDDHRLLRGAEGGLHPVRAVRGVP